MEDIKTVLDDRKKTHGDFKDHAKSTQYLMAVLMHGKNWHTLTPEYQEALHMICHKMARITTGNPYHRDHVTDIIGYATLMDRFLDSLVAKLEDSGKAINTEAANDHDT